MIEILTQEHVQKFIIEHQEDDPAQLALKADRFPDLPIRLIADQIKARQKAKLKIPSWFEMEGVLFPPGLPMEQCSSEITAGYKSEFLKGQSVADLTGGIGIDIFFISNQFNEAVYVEKQKDLCEFASHNFDTLKKPHIKVVNSSSEEFLKQNSIQFDWIYVDPARRNDVNQKLYRLDHCEPNVVELLPLLQKNSEKILIKTSPMLDIQQCLRQVDGISEVKVVAVRGEVKEVLYIVEKERKSPLKISTVNFLNHKTRHEFNFHPDSEIKNPVFGRPEQYIYEPNSAILKAGAFNSIAHQYDLIKLNSNSHIYTASNLINEFPGRKFEMIASIPYRKKEIKKVLGSEPANITVRNFSESVDMVRKKLWIKSGGDKYIFATTGPDQKPLILICRKV